MTSKPLISVVINFLNAERFIQEAIESVFAQTYSNWELLLVDDGSTDAGTDIALRYAGQHPRQVRYLEHPSHQNRGTSASRNLGIQNSTGAYISFLDADDIWLPHKLEQHLTILESHPEAAMVYSPALYWYTWEKNPKDVRRDFMQRLGAQCDTLFRPPTLLPRFLQNEEATPCTCGVLVRRSITERVGGFEENFRGMYDDQVFFIKVCLEAPVFLSIECSSRYRQHSHSACAVLTRDRHYSARWLFLSWLEKYLSEHEINDTEVWMALKKEVWPYHHPLLHSLPGRAKRFVSLMKKTPKWIARRTLPTPAHVWLRVQWQRYKLSGVSSK